MFLQTDRSDRCTLLAALLFVLLVKVGLSLLPFHMLYRLIMSMKRGLIRIGRFRPRSSDKIPLAIDRASRYVPAANCLTRALAGELWLALRGVATEIRIGVSKDKTGMLKAHAWLEYNGCVILGKLDGFSTYSPLPPFGGTPP